MSVSTAPQAGALPLRGASAVDCGKRTSPICTKYWSRAQSESIYNNTQQPAWRIGRVVNIPAWIQVAMGYDPGSVDAMVTAAQQATLNGGCLQLRWRKDKKGGQEWGYTTHPSYCWAK